MAFTGLFGRAKTTFYSSSQPLILPTKTGPERTLSELCKDVTPPCDLNPLLFNGHLQTAWTAVKADGPPIYYKRKVFEAEDPDFAGTFAVDFVIDKYTAVEDDEFEDPSGVGDNGLPPRTCYFMPKQWEHIGSDDTKPLLITLHGLSGGSHEIYLRHVLAPLVAPTAEGEKTGLTGGDWEALVINSRGCAGSKITTGILYNARATWDVRQVVKWARKTWPNRPIFAIGYSLGANILTNYVGEEGDECALKAAVVASNPWKLEVSSLALQRTYLGLEVYSKTMGTSMKKLFENHEEEITKNTAISLERVRKIKYLHEFDREVQCVTWGYPTEGAYYRDATSADSLLDIRIPFFAVHAEDDPIAVKEAIPYEEIQQNPYTVLCTTSTGGHLSWFEVGGGRWHAKPCVGFLNAMAREVDLDKIEAPQKTDTSGHGSGHRTPFVFKPMRRKLCVPEKQ